jgi:two-component system, chemotaxis family, chemotaxis protein CheY
MRKISTFSIIDDDELFQFTIKRVIKSTELVDKVLQFFDGETALNYFSEKKKFNPILPDIIFLDLNMPVMNGWQFLEAFLDLQYPKKAITIYICTSSVNPKDIAMYKKYSDVSGYFLKPISKTEIYSILDNELNHISTSLNKLAS